MKVTLRTVLAVALKDGEIALNVATLVDPPPLREGRDAGM